MGSWRIREERRERRMEGGGTLVGGREEDLAGDFERVGGVEGGGEEVSV